MCVNFFGSMKCMSMKSSSRLFCSGVPVRITLCSHLNFFSIPKSLLARFFSLWPSSTIMVP